MMSRILAFTALRAFFLGVIRILYPSFCRLCTRRRSNPRNPKASPFNVSTILVFSRLSSTPKGSSCSCKRCRARSAQPPLAPMPADGDHRIIREAVIVDRLIGPFRRLAAEVIEVPVHLVQVDVRGQRAEGTTLRHPFLSTSFDDQFDETQHFRVLHPACNLA